MRSATLWWDKLFLLLGLTRGNQSFSPDVYSEPVYLGLVSSESERSERSGHPCQILLVYRTNPQGLVVPMGSDVADKTIAVLSTCVRDTDYLGWYRQGLILGVLVTTLRPGAAKEGCDNLKIRLVDRLRSVRTLPGDHSFQIRVIEQGELNAFSVAEDSAASPDSTD